MDVDPLAVRVDGRFEVLLIDVEGTHDCVKTIQAQQRTERDGRSKFAQGLRVLPLALVQATERVVGLARGGNGFDGLPECLLRVGISTGVREAWVAAAGSFTSGWLQARPCNA